MASSEPQNGNDERSYPLSYRSDNTTWMASKETLEIQNDKHGSSRKDNGKQLDLLVCPSDSTILAAKKVTLQPKNHYCSNNIIHHAII